MLTIVTGGQTGADRAAMDCARALGLTVDGWVPAGRWAEDGRIPDRYTGLKETPGTDPAERTARNVRNSDATVVFSHGPLHGGSALTVRLAMAHVRPWMHIDLARVPQQEAITQLHDWLTQRFVRRLNVAGPRHSDDPQIYAATRDILLAVLDELH